MANRFKGADGIRGLACLIVLLLHVIVMFFPETLPAIRGAPKFGLWLFFVLSAFLLTRKFISSGFSALSICEYALGRFLRIYPVFIFVLLVFFLFKSVGMVSVSDLKSAIFLQRGYFHMWTIPVEFKFYAVLPFIALILINIYSMFGSAVVLSVSALMLIAHQFFWGYWNIPQSTIDTIWYVPCFFMGCVAAVCYEDSRKLVNSSSATIIALFSFAVLAMITNPFRLFVFGAPYNEWLLDKYIYIGLLWAVFVLFLIDGDGIFGRFFCSFPMRKIGSWSYSIYLVHWFFVEKLYSHFVNSIFGAILCSALSIAVGAVLYYVVESPVENFRHRIRFRANGTRMNSRTLDK